MVEPLMPYDEALARLLSGVTPSDRTELVPLSQAVGRVVAHELMAPRSLPAFAASAMDGIALRAEWTARATEAAPVTLNVVGEVFAGDSPGAAIATGGVQISTGAPLPLGYDAVVRKEDIVLAADRRSLRVSAPVAIGNDIRLPGEDFKHGQAVLLRGRRIGLRELPSLAALGVAEVRVFCRPKVTVITTGNELTPVGKSVTQGAIYDSNGPMLQAAFAAMGCAVTLIGCVSDEAAMLTAAVADHLDADLIVTAGAVSEGTRDLIPEVAASLGARPLFHKVAIRPGKPMFACRLGRATWIGVPGNPLSALVGARFFADPVVRQLYAQPSEQAFSLRLATAVTTKAPLLHFLRARYDLATGLVACSKDQASHLTRSLLDASTWVLCEGGRSYAEHESVRAYPLFDLRSEGSLS